MIKYLIETNKFAKMIEPSFELKIKAKLFVLIMKVVCF